MKKDKFNPKMTRRQILKAGMIGGAGMMLPLRFLPAKAWANGGGGACTILGCTNMSLSDPSMQPKFVEDVPNALDPGFKYKAYLPNKYAVGVGAAWHKTGLVKPDGNPAWTKIYGYGQKFKYTWPGMTFEVKRSNRPMIIWWRNQLWGQTEHILPVDTSLHWAFSLPGYEQYSIAKKGIPIITHVHGGHTDFQFDGNPEWFYTPGNFVRGPAWKAEGVRFTTRFRYDINVPAGCPWYHDHALGITRLNVYAGMAGFIFIRDKYDTGGLGYQGHDLGLPKFPYEMALAIQDRMFKKNGRLFYPAFPGDPYWFDFITDQGLLDDQVPQPSALAEFFGDHMLVNGIIWPKADVEPRNYRLRLLNGCDSRFLAVQFFEVPAGATDFTVATGPLDFTVIGSDQGLASSPTTVDTLLIETGSRYDIVFNFKNMQGKRIIMKNIGGDEPFGGDLVTDPDDQIFKCTDRIMAFDVADMANQDDGFNSAAVNQYGGNSETVNRVRKVALFEGMDEFGRLQPLLGTAEPATDYLDNPIYWPDKEPYISAGLVGQMEGSIAWHSPTTENPALGDTEIWEIYNATGDAHPVHLHLVNFEILDRREFTADVIDQPVVQHNGTRGNGFRLGNIVLGDLIDQSPEYVENAPKDMVTALPGQVTRIKATFDKPGKYVWHCHILSHEDHEMMRVLHVGEGA